MGAPRYLVTTADERTWKFDRPVLFLGEWCRLYERKQTWSGMDAIVAPAFGAQEKNNNAKYINNLYSELLIELVEQLNNYHNTNHGLRYWTILLGHWLRRYLEVMFNRYFTIEKALNEYVITGTTVFDSANHILAKPDSSSFIYACNDDIWNNVLYARIIKYMGCKNIELESIAVKNEKTPLPDLGFVAAKLFNMRQVLKAIGRNILPRMSRGTDAFIINSYLPKWQEIKLQLALGQCPQFWQSLPLTSISIDIAKRKKLVISGVCRTSFEQCARELLPDIIPGCYLEGYSELNQKVESLSWPSNPKFIFTSNNFDTDEIFKAWTGLKVEQGVPYFTGQHGNNYGTHHFFGNFISPERSAVDKFFTWGWSDGSIKTIPAFVFKIANYPRVIKPDGGLLLIELCAPHLLHLDDAYHEFGFYQEEQFRFVEALPEKIKKDLTIRLHGGWRSMRWSDDKRWSDRIPLVNVETGKAPIQKLIARSRLVVHSYDSTGILEGLASNIPTLCFWNGGLDHLLPSAKPYYELLRGAGIFADSAEHAATLVERYWDNIDEWWKSEKVQSARKLFCEQYARVEKDPVRTMRRLLTTAAIGKDIEITNNVIGRR